MSIKYKNQDLHGVINVYKEKGFTSHDVVAVIRKITGAKTGHTGTLDPDAEGVLPVCLGKATRLSDYIMSDIKEYSAEVILGKTTDTQDASGVVLEEKDVALDFPEIEKAVNSFVGEYWQTPPMYSAIKVGGKKLYELARQGKEVERKKRLINIYDIEIIDYKHPDIVKINVTCSKGTYIRTLCADIGQKLNCGAHMGGLLRVRTGDFTLANSIKLDEIKRIVAEGKINDILISADAVLKEFKRTVVSEEANKFLYNGNKINVKYADNSELFIDDILVVYDSQNCLIGIYKIAPEKEELFLKPMTMLI